MDGPEIPPFFLCPISLQMMKDPVTISTGITFDRENIHRWLFLYKKTTCPVTKQTLTDRSFTPNCTLQRLIDSWRAANPSTSSPAESSSLVPCVTISVEDARKLMEDASSPDSGLKSLRRIKSLVKDNDSNKKLMEEAGLIQVAASLVVDNYSRGLVISQFENEIGGEESLSVLSLLDMTPEISTKLAGIGLTECLSWVLQRGSYVARVHAVTILRSMFKVMHHNFFMDLKAELFDGVVEILKDQNSNQATSAALSILMEVCPWGKNRLRAVEAGVLPVIIEFLAENNERKRCETLLAVLELLCGRAEGRAAFVSHPMGVAVVSRKIFRVSHTANEKAVKVLLLVSKYSSSPELIQEMVDVGAVMKICMVLQMECHLKTKEKAREILRLHGRQWKESPCVPLNGLSSVFKAVGEMSG
ncbi:E3 ubiquitin-protein ligase [Nymphaea thermarum]|nr:E3 ubiquitin-protein ligase [Nymphaea thermarum]